MLRQLLVVLLLPACFDRSLPKDSSPSELACMDGPYAWACVSDCPDGADPRCPGDPTAQVGQMCSFPGVECEYASHTLIGCDCEGSLHCLSGACPFGMPMTCGDPSAGVTCGPLQLCVQITAFSVAAPPDLGSIDTRPQCVDDPAKCTDFGSSNCPDPCVQLGARFYEAVGPRTVQCVE